MITFAAYVLAHLPPAPARVLEVGCGVEGGVAHELAAAGYDVLAIDPHAPDGDIFRRTTLEELDDPGPFDAAVAGRVLHHVDPLGAGLDKLARLAPLLVVDEFAPERLVGTTQDWYEAQHRALTASGNAPDAPSSLEHWRAAHAEIAASETVLAALRARYEELECERLPYLYRWLGGPATEPLEESLIAAGAIDAVGLRWVGRSTMAVWPPGSPG